LETKFAAGIPNLEINQVAAVFFDFGETLAILSPSKEEMFISAALSVGLQLDAEAVRRAYQIVDFHAKYSSVHVKDRNGFYRDYNEKLCEALAISSHFVELQPALAMQFKQNSKWKLIDEVPVVLDRLCARGVPLALVANWDSNLPLLTEQLGIRQAFAAIVPSQAIGKEKPDPEIFRFAAVSLGLSAESDRILYLGNEYRADVLGSRAAGLIPVLIDRNHFYRHADCPRFSSLLQWWEVVS
jgi:FMN phosphatase YigB (HAD superfamily)